MEINDSNEQISPMNDLFHTDTKSAVKLAKNSRGVTWEVKVVAGEEHLIDSLMEKAVSVHNSLIQKIEKEGSENGTN